MNRVWPVILVGLGGFLGANARYLSARWIDAAAGGRFPLATFLINITGSFLLGLLGGVLASRLVPNADSVRLALGVGFLGAFTTFSTFEFETHALLEDGVWWTAAANIALSVAVGLMALRAGIVLAKAWFGG
jgi:fluoride exporter